MKMCSEVFQFEKELKWENPDPGIRRQIMGYDELSVQCTNIITVRLLMW